MTTLFTDTSLGKRRPEEPTVMRAIYTLAAIVKARTGEPATVRFHGHGKKLEAEFLIGD